MRICEICDTPIEAGQSVAYPIEGWEVPRGQGGANRILGRRRLPDRIAHLRCVEKDVRVGAAQGSLL